MQIRYLITLLISAIILHGCSSPPETISQQVAQTSKVTDPSNEALKTAMLDFLKKNNAPISSTYNFVRFDLNGDKRRDALVMIKSPYGYWCGTHGCIMLIMKAHDTGFTLVNSIQPVREPIYISRAKINGWNNIIVRVSGRLNGETKDVALRFDGAHYPKDPTKLGEYPLSPNNHPDFIRVLYNDGLKD
jgi:hypothetical protein